MNQEDFVKDFNSAGHSSSNNYFAAGDFDVTIDTVKMVRGFNGLAMIVEAIVNRSNNPQIPAGSKRSWVCAFKHKSAFSDSKEFVAAAIGKDLEKVTDADLAPVTNQNTLRGLKMHVTATEKPTKRGGIFTKLVWSLAQPEEN